jgi:hypothetical protein
VTSKILVYLLSALFAIEIISILVVRWTASRQRRLLQRQLAGRTMESLDEPQREKVLSTVAGEYDQTIYRKSELLVIAFHIPALASWGIATRQSTTPPLYYHAATMAFWLALVFGFIKVIAKLRGA